MGVLPKGGPRDFYICNVAEKLVRLVPLITSTLLLLVKSCVCELLTATDFLGAWYDEERSVSEQVDEDKVLVDLFLRVTLS